MEIHQGPFTVFFPDECLDDAPVAFLLGWAGAADRALKKYAELLAGLRFRLPSIRSVQPITNIFSPIDFPRRRWTQNLLACYQNLCPQRPIILFAFSNGGAFVVEQLQFLAALPNYHYLQTRILGCVFDSAPGYMHHEMGPKVIKAEMPPGFRRTITIATLMGAVTLTPLLYGDRKTIYWDCMREMHLGGHMLYFYSTDDPLCDAEKLRELIAAKREAGQDVTAVEWEESEHCGHLKRHRDEYEAALQRFLTEKLEIDVKVHRTNSISSKL